FEYIIPDYAGGKVYPYRAGDKIFVFFEFDQSGNEVWQAADFVRDGYITAMVIGFLLLLVLFGRAKGLNTVISLIFTTAAVFFVMIPAIIKGWNIYAITFAITAYIVFMTLGVVIGVNSKSLSAGVGCLCGVGIAGIITVVMQNLMKLSGLINEESYFVMFINPQRPIYLPAVIFAAIVIGALGATMDVSMSIASSLEEIALHKPDIAYGELIKSGLNIGRDIMGTMANTLILAYVGSSLNVVLLMLAYNRSISTIINREMIAVEILQAVAGSVGILLTLPATTLIAAFFHKKIK
ncbi:MAG TPA: YibE/F family protein, partial [Ruminococcaceae bacterium]|nr:YibE/F family protein [Oscillospiraceae bacterium]